ncbi:MAG: dihydrolipoamide acetyltransferase family protein [Gemmatimonadetes bacterium]|nr:dihydrolipoamide acetyltransferase family protein [Gemmatimonadota bacterium]
MAEEIRLPDLGEGIDQGDVVRILVSEGDSIEVDQPVIELETDKALVEVPSSVAGTVATVNVSSGESISPGAVLVTVDAEQAGDTPEAVRESNAKDKTEQQPPTDAPAERRAPPDPVNADMDEETPAAVESSSVTVPAAPSVRRFARELGVDLRQVPGSGAGGRITRDDVKSYVQSSLNETAQAGPVVAPDLPDFTRWGRVERQPLPGVRRTIAQNVGTAWAQVPHVTQFDRADVTDLEAFRQRHKAGTEARGGKLTPTSFVLKAVVSALKAFPQFNASLDPAGGQLVLKHYYHIGVAVDTERGLLVPVIRDVDRRDIFELAIQLDDLARRTREGRADLEELQGGTFTVTNLGSIGGTSFTPIVNFPEVAILGMGRSRQEPVVRDGRIEARLIMPVCLSYDHRVVDGADGARFTRHLVESLENPERMLLGG